MDINFSSMLGFHPPKQKYRYIVYAKYIYTEKSNTSQNVVTTL